MICDDYIHQVPGIISTQKAKQVNQSYQVGNTINPTSTYGCVLQNSSRIPGIRYIFTLVRTSIIFIFKNTPVPVYTVVIITTHAKYLVQQKEQYEHNISKNEKTEAKDDPLPLPSLYNMLACQ